MAMTRKMFTYRASRAHEVDYDYSKVPGVLGTRVVITCPEHGVFERLTREFLRGRGCSQCQAGGKRKVLLDEFVKRAREVHGDLYSYERVGVAYPRMTITCKVHGDFEQSKASHLRGSGCPVCHPPFCRPSKAASRWLDALGLPNDPEHREVKGLIPGRLFRVDGFDPDTNTVYEFYGDAYHGNPTLYPPEMVSQITRKSFGQMNQERLERERLIREAGFQLVTVWEHDFKNPLGLPPKTRILDLDEVTQTLNNFIEENPSVLEGTQ
jgi:hypothetical protein